MKTDTGEEAFPIDYTAHNRAQDMGPQIARGMTLLDYFAGQALENLGSLMDRPLKRSDDLAKFAYDVAESMIAEKRRRESDGGI